MEIYNQYEKPSFAPPAAVFGPVWTVLYILIAVSFGVVFVNVAAGKWPFIVAVPFILNLIFNLAYYSLQFSASKLTLATIDIVLVLGTIIWMMVAVFPYSKAVFYAQIPYLLWVAFATVLQFSIRVKN